MAQVYSFKIQGQTSGGTAIATVAVSWDGDSFIRFTDANGDPRSISIANGCYGDFAALMKLIFTGAGGIDAGSTGVQGKRVFGEPVLPQ